MIRLTNGLPVDLEHDEVAVDSGQPAKLESTARVGNGDRLMVGDDEQRSFGCMILTGHFVGSWLWYGDGTAGAGWKGYVRDGVRVAEKAERVQDAVTIIDKESIARRGEIGRSSVSRFLDGNRDIAGRGGGTG